MHHGQRYDRCTARSETNLIQIILTPYSRLFQGITVCKPGSNRQLEGMPYRLPLIYTFGRTCLHKFWAKNLTS
jgi:hypothetical protein